MPTSSDRLYNWTESDAKKARRSVPIEVATLVLLLKPGFPEDKKQEFVTECIGYLNQIREKNVSTS